MRLEDEGGNDTGHDGTEADGVAASAVEDGGGRRRSGGDSAGGETDGGQGGAGGGLDGRNTSGGDLGGGGSGESSSNSGGGGGGSGSSLSLGADSGGDLGALDNGGRSNRGGGGSGGLSGGASDGAGAGDNSGGDTELGGVLVLAGTLNNEKQTVVGDVGLQVSARSPAELAAVGDGLGKSLEGEDVGGGTAQKNEGDRANSGGSPLDGVGLALGHDLIQTRVGDGIAAGLLVVIRSSVGSSQSHEGRESGGDSETHDVVSRLTKSDWGEGKRMTIVEERKK